MSTFLSYPLPPAASLPAALTGPCTVFLCGNIAGGANSTVSCDAILGLCVAGSSRFSAFPTPSSSNTTAPQIYPCNYDFKNGTANSYTSVAVACGLVSLAATVSFQDADDQYLVSSLPSASSQTSNILTLSEYVPIYNATQWPNDWLDVRTSLSSLAAYFTLPPANSTGTSPTSTPAPTAPPKSGSVKGASLTGLLMVGMALPLVLTALW